MKPNPLRRGFKTESEKKSLEIRQKLSIGLDTACPARKVADLYKVSITPTQCLSHLVKAHLSDIFQDQTLIDQRLNWLLRRENKFSAIVAIIGDFKMILYNANHSQARQESDIMHELAHIICEHPGDCLQLNADIAIRQYNDEHEAEAQWLGATLQIPEKGLYNLVQSGLSNEAIANRYVASLDMVKFRRQKLGIDKRLSYSKNYF